jgi:hypothetical protein
MPAVSAPGFSLVFCSESLGAMNAFVWLICALNGRADRHPGKECKAWQHGSMAMKQNWVILEPFL